MPFQSEKQRRFMWAKHPDIAEKWAHEYSRKSRKTTDTGYRKAVASLMGRRAKARKKSMMP